ncbi:sugar ABC transporter permease [Clostridia bacterium]|nr:sugar ABC transporter permease [Clostridia bacterium]
MHSRTAIRLSAADRVFHLFNYIFLALCFMIIAVPLMNLVSQSLSSAPNVFAGKVLIWPMNPSLEGYSRILRNKGIVGGFINSSMIVVGGTAISVTMTILAAYPLSRKTLVGHRLFMWLFTFTMLFGAGLIPMYMLIQSLGMIDSLWSLMIPNAVGAWNVIITKTFFENTIPDDLYDAANIDGCSDLRTFWSIVLPLSKPIVAIMVLYSAVGLWNNYFDSMIYLQSSSKFPLQLVLRNIMTSSTIQASMTNFSSMEDNRARLAMIEVMKYAVIVLSSLPMIAIYPFVQKYFVKGIMIGAVKG